MLRGTLIYTTIMEEITVIATSYLQVGVLSLLLWNLVVEGPRKI